MCHTTTTARLLCQHITSSTAQCTAASGYLLPSFLSSIFSPPKCIRTSSHPSLDSFCPICQDFWNKLEIGEQDARERVLRWRKGNVYHGPITPLVGEGVGFVSFRRDDESGDRRKGGRGIVSATEHQNNQISEPNSENKNELRLRRSSSSSTCTLWPGLAPMTVSGADQPPSENRTGSETLLNAPSAGEADIDKHIHDGLVEPDESEKEIEIPIAKATFLLNEGLIHPDAFELDAWNEDLPSLANAGGFEKQEISEVSEAFPREELEKAGEDRKLC